MLIVIVLLLGVAGAQSCIGQDGQPVPWWVVLKVPPMINATGYGYYDSRMGSPEFLFYGDEVDGEDGPLGATIVLINQMNLTRVAWNDEKPGGSTSSTSAHSKGVIAFDSEKGRGFFISHSIPKYPAFVNGQVDPIIAPSEQYFGQHISCFTLLLTELEKIAEKLLPTKPNHFESTVTNTPNTQNLYKLGNGILPPIGPLFSTIDLRSAIGYTIKIIFKDGRLNGSIFEDGLTSFLGTNSLVAETWGRPLAQPWCSWPFQVKNVKKVQLEDLVWRESNDHSKWALAGREYACFGDMNRMTSQWKRGGSFYCLSHAPLVQALSAVILETDTCEQ